MFCKYLSIGLNDENLEIIVISLELKTKQNSKNKFSFSWNAFELILKIVSFAEFLISYPAIYKPANELSEKIIDIIVETKYKNKLKRKKLFHYFCCYFDSELNVKIKTKIFWINVLKGF